MKNGNWVAIDKTLTSSFCEIRREYSKIEAMFSLSCDVNCGKQRSEVAYSRMWSWSRGKVKRFIETAKTNGQGVDMQRTSNGHAYSLLYKDIQDATDKERTSNGQGVDTKYKEQDKEQDKEVKDIIPKPERPAFISQELWKPLLANRKFKKLQNTELALKTFCNAIAAGIEKGYTAEECIGEFVSSSWKRFNVEWMNGKADKQVSSWVKADKPMDKRSADALDLLSRL